MDISKIECTNCGSKLRPDPDGGVYDGYTYGMRCPSCNTMMSASASVEIVFHVEPADEDAFFDDTIEAKLIDDAAAADAPLEATAADILRTR